MNLPAFADPRLAWFFAADLTGGDIVLSAEETHHAVHVMRLATGDEIILFDGVAKLARGAIREIRKRGAVIEIKNCAAIAAAETRGFPAVATAIPKGDRWQILIEKLTESGADEILPLIFAHSATRKFSRDAASRWSRETCKQARRVKLPAIANPQTLPEFLRAWQNKKIYLADPNGENFFAAARSARKARGIDETGETDADNLGNSAVIIGPEGGLTAAEITECEKFGARKIKFGEYILRVETAAIVAANVIANFRTDFAE